jgi:hypothetical protein
MLKLTKTVTFVLIIAVIGGLISGCESGTKTVWINNSNGSRTRVELTKSADGYTGPRNEHYDSLPSRQQLRLVYGF